LQRAQLIEYCRLSIYRSKYGLERRGCQIRRINVD